MVKYKLYAFIGELVNITECEINNEDLLKYLNYKIGTRCIFTPYDDYKYAGQECEVIEYVKYGEDDWCYNVKFRDEYTQRIYEGELELVTVKS